MSDIITQRLKHVVLADPEFQVRMDLGRTLLHLADTVDRFIEGHNALAFIQDHQPEIAVLDLGCWMEPDVAIADIKAVYRDLRTILVLTYRKLLPNHIGKLNSMKIEHVVGHPLEPLYLFRLAHDKFGVKARRHARVQIKLAVFWGAESNHELIGYTADISRGGLLLVSDKHLSPGASLFLGVQLDANTTIEFRAQIVQKNKQIFSPAMGYGMSFVDLNTTTALVMDEFVARFDDSGADHE